MGVFEGQTLVAGHSFGEIAAVCLAGGCSFQQCLDIAEERSRIFHDASACSDEMFALRIRKVDQSSLDKILQPLILGTGAEISAINSPMDVTLTAPKSEDHSFVRMIQANKELKHVHHLNCMTLNTSGGYHTQKLKPFADRLTSFTSKLITEKLKYQLISTVDGAVHSDIKTINELIGRQLYSPVLFWKMIETSLEVGCNEFVELSKKPILTSFIQTIVLPLS